MRYRTGGKRQPDLTDAARDCIDWYAAYGPATVREYAEDMGLHYSTALHRVMALERHGVVQRSPRTYVEPQQRVVELTARGRAVWRDEVCRGVRCVK